MFSLQFSKFRGCVETSHMITAIAVTESFTQLYGLIASWNETTAIHYVCATILLYYLLPIAVRQPHFAQLLCSHIRLGQVCKRLATPVVVRQKQDRQ